MIHKLVSCKTILAQAYRDFAIKNSTTLLDDGIEWIGELMETIGTSGNYEFFCADVFIEDHRGFLPCPTELLIGITKNGFKVYPNPGVNVPNTNVDTTLLNLYPTQIADYNRMGSCIDGSTYELKGNCIHTSFNYGWIKVYGEKIATDEEGFPCIPSNIEVKNALTWGVLMKMLGTGKYEHPTFKYADAEARWLKYYPRAQNALMMPNFDRYLKFKEHMVSLVPYIDRERNSLLNYVQ